MAEESKKEEVKQQKESQTQDQGNEKEEEVKEEEEQKKQSAEESSKEECQKEEEEVEVPEKFKKLVEEIEKMSVLDLAELVKILEKKFGVSAAAPVVAGPMLGPGAAPGVEEGKEEKTEFDVLLAGPGDKKIEVIKAVREITGKGLKECKDLVDASANEPQMVKDKVKKEEAEEIKAKLEAVGAKVELK